MTDHVKLTVPAREEFARTVRMTAAALAGRMGMSIDEVEDVRIAVEEAFVFAIGRLDAGEPVSFDFGVDDDRLSLDVGPLPSRGAEEAEGPEARYARFILESVCDTFDFEDSDTTCSLKLIKKAAR
jgi:serine/threonine-protein kinase RsbW